LTLDLAFVSRPGFPEVGFPGNSKPPERPNDCKARPSQAKRSDLMTNEVPSESNRVRRLFRERFTFQISVDTPHAPQGLAVAEAALNAGVTILELGTRS
jgi:hypothetical protein